VATINLTLSGFEDTLSDPATQYKEEDGAAYNGSTQDFFSSIAGTIGIGGHNVMIDHMVFPFRFQIGPGANAKDPNEFGASAWIQEKDGGTYQDSHHWDFNLRLQYVPEPATLFVWSFLLSTAGAVLYYKRRSAA
ncbi:MAG: hypothetical protein ACR2NU_08480, partial [Aeoliella sp.]